MSKVDKERDERSPETENNAIQSRQSVRKALIEDAKWKEPEEDTVDVSVEWHPTILADTKNKALYERFSQIDLGKIYLVQGPFGPIFGQLVLDISRSNFGAGCTEMLKRHLPEEAITQVLEALAKDVLKNFPDDIMAQMLLHVVGQRKKGGN